MDKDPNDNIEIDDDEEESDFEPTTATKRANNNNSRKKTPIKKTITPITKKKSRTTAASIHTKTALISSLSGSASKKTLGSRITMKTTGLSKPQSSGSRNTDSGGGGGSITRRYRSGLSSKAIVPRLHDYLPKK